MTTAQRLLAEHARIARLRRTAVILRVSAVAVAALTLGALLLGRTQWLRWPRAVPLLVWGVAAAAAWAFLQWQKRRRALRTEPGDVAKAIESERGLRDGAARTLLEVASWGGPFVARADALLGAKLGGEALAPQLWRATVRGTAIAAGTIVLVAALAVRTGSSHGDGWRVLFHPASAWAGTLLPRITFDDPPAGLLRGDTAPLRIHAPGRELITVRQRATGGAWRDTTIAVRDGAAAWRVGPLDADLLLVATDGRAESDTLRLRLAERSFVGDVTVTAHFPPYLGRADESLPAEAGLRIPQGTALTVTGRASETLSTITLGGDGVRVPLTASGRGFAGRFVPRSSGTLVWTATGATGPIADLPPPLQLDVVPDSAPQVDFLSPGSDSSVSPAGAVRVAVAAVDDRVLRDVTLAVWTVRGDGQASAPQTRRLFDGGAPSYLGAVALDLGALALQAGDVVHVQASAHDDTPWGQVGKSRALLLRVPAAEDQRREARAAADSLVAQALAAARAQQRLEQRTSEAARARNQAETGKAGERRSQDAMSYDAAEKAKALAKEQGEMAARARAVEEATRELEERLRAAGGLDSSLQAQLREAQQLMREAMTPELMAAMKKLEGAAQELSQDRTRQSLADLAEQQKRLREALEKSAEMLKRAALEGQMKTLREDATSMAKRQRQLADSGAADPARAKTLAEQTESLAREIQQLQQRLERERANAGARQAEGAASQAQASREAMQRAAQEPTRDARAQAAREAAQAMQQAGDALSKAREQQVSAWKNDVTGSLDKAVQEMMQMARQQEQLADQVQGKQAGEQQGDVRGQQSALQQGVQRAGERLSEQAKKSAMVSPGAQQAMREAQQRVDQAMRDANSAQSGQGSPSQQASSMREAAQALRQAASALARDRERVEGAQSGSGVPEMIEELQKLAQQQGNLNSQMAGLFPTPNQKQGTDAASLDKARVLARQQRAVARALDDVQDLDATGRTRELAREARTLAQALEAGVADPSTLDRQQRLFRKMLDAGRLLQQEERDEQGPRESKPGDKVSPFAPPDGAARGAEALKYRAPTWDELRTLAPEERRAVLEYFRRLNSGATADGGRRTAEPPAKP
ncbi:MAG: hypothetical protein H3C62_08055 [Gemmatimonadaceae bacterium]|nr:hypothetical protein [Gemmatimonadaceae bacterium]